MRRHKKKKLNLFKLLIAIVAILALCFAGYKIITRPKEPAKIYMTNIIGKDVSLAKEELGAYNLDIILDYKYSDTVPKDKVISQSIPAETEINKGDKLALLVSLGQRDKAKLKADGINELGKVPVMMYHGIRNMKNSETVNTGGNVDKDGYTRTAEAFRNDLEFYYSKGYRMIKLSDYVTGNIATEYGKSPIVLTFDDGNDNNIKVTGLDSEGNIIIDENSAVGILESFKKKYPDYNVTAIFFVTGALFNQPEYNEKIIKWLVDNGYEVGNHTKGHNNLTKTTEAQTSEVIGYVYNQLDSIIPNKYTKIVALPFGTPYNRDHANYKHVINSEYNGKKYETIAALRVGWEPEVSSYNKEFDSSFIKRCRAYDNNGKEFDIEMVFKMLDKTRFISDGDASTIITSNGNKDLISDTYKDKEIITYE